jgi:hypothetical protein
MRKTLAVVNKMFAEMANHNRRQSPHFSTGRELAAVIKTKDGKSVVRLLPATNSLRICSEKEALREVCMRRNKFSEIWRCLGTIRFLYRQ